MAGWLWLLAGTFGEVIWVMTLKFTEGFTKPLPTLVNLVIAFLNMWILSIAFKLLPTATAYTVWVGASAMGVAIAAFVLQGEQMGAIKVLCMAVIMAGVMGLGLSRGM